MIGVGRVRAACNGTLTCQVLDKVVGCTSVGAKMIPCVDNGTACVWDSACQYCPAFGGDCSGTSDGGGGGGTSTACGNAAAPACEGACSGGQVCRNVSGSCACRTANSCDDYVSQPGNISITRVSPTSADDFVEVIFRVTFRAQIQMDCLDRRTRSRVNRRGNALRSPAPHQ